jgi:hypothetical protein
MGIKDTMRGGSGGTHAATGRQDFPHAPRLAPSGDMGTPEINTLVRAANPMPAGGTAPEGTTKIYQTPATLRGYGKAAHAVPNESMPGIKDHYKDLRRGTNNSGKNPENQTMGRQTARDVSVATGGGKSTMIQDAYGKPTTNNLGVSY